MKDLVAFVPERLVRPSAKLSNPSERKAAAFTSTLLLIYSLVMVILGFLVYLWPDLFVVHPAGKVSVVVGVFTNAAAYLVSRSRHYRYSSLMVLMNGLLLVGTVVNTNPTPTILGGALPWLMVNFSICTLVLSMRGTLVAFGATCALYIQMALFVPKESVGVLYVCLLSYVSISVFALIGKSLRTQAQRSLQESVDDHAATIAVAPVGITRVSLDGRLLAVNSVYCDLLGRGQEELIGLPIRTLVHPDEQGDTAQAFSSMLSGETERYYAEKRYLHRSRGDIWVAVTSRLVRTALGEPSHYVTITQDISDRIEHERQRSLYQAKLALASKMAALGEMSSGIAHEINNPLAIIVGRAGQLEKQAQSPSPDLGLLRKYTQNISEMALRISKIIRGLRSFARDGRQDPFSSVDVSTIIDEILVLCGKRFRDGGVELVVERHLRDENLKIECRQTEVGQVLLNLLGNAYDAVAEAPRKWVVLSVRETALSVEFEVRDSGPGVPETLRDKIMQPFYTTKEVGKGTGLGLSVSRGLTESHGGTLSLVPTPEGACFVASFLKLQPGKGSLAAA